MLRKILLACLLSLPAFAQYNEGAGRSAAAPVVREVEVKQGDGTVKKQKVVEEVKKDQFGNAAGNNHDLAIDGAFDGQTIVVLHLYTETAFDFQMPKSALAEKGFSVYRYINTAPTPAELAKSLEKANQLWIIAGGSRQLNDEHAKVIKKFFDAGHGLYIWGDNAPYAQDADFLSRALFDVELKSSPWDQGEQVVGRQTSPSGTGLLADHLLTTGIEQLYEGHTIAFMPKPAPLTPLIVGSQKHVVAAFFDKDGKRAIVDGGFTRLYVKWDTAGTGRYVKNAAAWLANAERFGDKVVAKKK
ncbi:MAG: hypothetical protein JNM17_22160 [Archangium sp.]|nr:hypothetical protein [Archangium sp.]